MEKDDIEFQIQLLRIEVENNMITEFFSGLIGVLIAALFTLGISLALVEKYNVYIVFLQLIILILLTTFAYVTWKEQNRRINKNINDLRDRFIFSENNN